MGEWAEPHACLDLPSVLVDKGGLASDNNFLFLVSVKRGQFVLG